MFKIGGVDVMCVKNLLFFLAKVAADHTDDTNVREETGGDREVGGGAAQHFVKFSKGRFDRVERNRTNYE